MLTPPFCPNDQCEYHHRPPETGDWYRKKGSYHTQVSGEVIRFVCLNCRRGFSEQTFRLDYYVKRKLDYQLIFDSINNCAGVRKVARKLQISHQAISNRLGRMARQAMALQAQLSEQLRLREDLVTDGFESYVKDKWQPNNIHILMGSDSQFLYGFDFAHLRRKGRMSERQKLERNIRESQYLQSRISITQSFRQLLFTVEELLASSSQKSTRLFSDEKLEYARAIEDNEWLQELVQRGSFTHVRISSKLSRTPQNPLFPVNYYDRQLRKDNANHVRKTVRFSQNVNNCLERFAVYQMQHNYFKPYRIEQGKKKRNLRHGEVAGLERREIEAQLKDIFHLRRFFTKVKLNRSQLMLWARMIGTLDQLDGGYKPRYIWM